MMLFQQYKVQKAKLSENRKYLKRGVYLIWKNSRTYVHAGSLFHKSLAFPNEIRGVSNLIRMLVGMLLFGVLVIRRPERADEGVV